MKMKSIQNHGSVRFVSIGNRLYARTRVQTSLLEQYRQLQAECAHEKRDPRGTCYHCGGR
jgi:hypothetical protein